MRTITVDSRYAGCGPLILVNREHPLSDFARGADLAPLSPLHPDILMDRGAAALLGECLKSVRAGGEIVPVSGWRSRSRQQAIWDETIAASGGEFTRRYVARPGCSEHETGLAIDLGKRADKIDFIRPELPYDGVFGAFRRAAARFGFIERYRQGCEDRTGIAAEPWHFRYVGVPHAQLIEENGLCLEEYAGFLDGGARTCRLENGRPVTVMRVPCRGGSTEIELPDGCCQVSGDNAGGFIVTAWGSTL